MCRNTRIENKPVSLIQMVTHRIAQSLTATLTAAGAFANGSPLALSLFSGAVSIVVLDCFVDWCLNDDNDMQDVQDKCL